MKEIQKLIKKMYLKKIKKKEKPRKTCGKQAIITICEIVLQRAMTSSVTAS